MSIRIRVFCQLAGAAVLSIAVIACGSRPEGVNSPPPNGESTGVAAASPTTASGRTVTTEPAAHPNPSFRYPGDPECAITYGPRGSGSMYWTANVTVAGTLRTHAGDTAGDLYAHVASVTPGPNGLEAPQPLWKIDDIGGVLYSAGGKSYAYSIAPAS